MSAPHTDDRLAEVLRVLARMRRAAPSGPRIAAVSPTLTEVGLRLSALEREVGEVRSRVNGVLFAVVASVLAQLAAKVVAG